MGIASLILGWGLKTLTDSFAWRRQQVLDAYVDLLAASDTCATACGWVWNKGQTMKARTQEWVDQALLAQQKLERADLATSKVFMVAKPAGAAAAIHLYVALLKIYRRSIAVPPHPRDHYHAAEVEFVKLYHMVVDQARREMILSSWRDRLPGRVSRFELTDRLIKALDTSDPVPIVGQQPPP